MPTHLLIYYNFNNNLFYKISKVQEAVILTQKIKSKGLIIYLKVRKVSNFNNNLNFLWINWIYSKLLSKLFNF